MRFDWIAPTLSPNQRWVENSVQSIESIESTRLVGLVVESSYRKSIYRSSESIRPRLIAIRLDGTDSIPKQRWVENSVESIDSIESTRLVGLVVESSYRKSIYRSSESIRPRLIAIRLDCADSIPKPEVG